MKRLLKSTALLTLAISTISASSFTYAHEKGNLIVRAGVALVEPNEESTSIRIDQPDLGYVWGAKVGVDSDVQLGLTGTYMVTDKIGVGLLAATPFSHDISGAGIIAGAGKLGETKHLPPTLTAQFYLAEPEDKFQPYIGLGINYTTFFSEKTTQTLTDSIGVLASIAQTPVDGVVATSTKMKLDDSFGAALELGFDYPLTENIGLNASFWYIDLETTAEITAQTNVGEVRASTDVKIDPYVYFVGLSYTF
jgi:outer membrane protein